jgi:hypothetical protein
MIYFAFWDDSGYMFWMTRGVWGPSFKREKLVIFSLFGVFLAFFPLGAVFWFQGPHLTIKYCEKLKKIARKSEKMCKKQEWCSFWP